MTGQATRPLFVADKVLRVVTVLNLLMGAGILGMLVFSLLSPEVFLKALGFRLEAESRWTLFAGMRGIMLLGLVGIPFVHAILTRLRAIVTTVAMGDPFVLDNATRLHGIAWCMVALEALHVTIGTVAVMISTPANPLDIDWAPSLTRWLAILLCFVLAIVFAHGARMREELEGTI